MGGFLRMLEARPKDLGGSHADQIFVLRGLPECFAVRFSEEMGPASPHPMKSSKVLTYAPIPPHGQFPEYSAPR